MNYVNDMNYSFVMMKCNNLKLKNLISIGQKYIFVKKCQPLYHVIFVFMLKMEGIQVGYL